MEKHGGIPSIGFALYWLAEIMSFYATTAFADVGTMSTSLEDVYVFVLIFSRIVTYAVVIVLRSRSHHEGLSPLPVAVIATTASLVGIALLAGTVAQPQLLDDPLNPSTALFSVIHSGSWPLALFVLGAALLGSSQGVMGLVWSSKLTLYSYRGRYLYFIGTHLVATVLCAITLLLPPSWILPVTVAALVGANICSVKMPRASSLPSTVREHASDIVPLLWRGALAVGVFAFVSGFVSSIAHQNYPTYNAVDFQFFTLASSCIELVVMALPALVFHQPLKLETSYRIALPLSALGFLVLPGLIESVPSELSGILATSGYMITGIVLSCLVSEVSKIARVPSLPLFAGSDGFALVCLLAGVCTGFSMTPSLAQTSTGTALVGLGCLYLVALAASWLLGRSSTPSSKQRNASRRKQEVSPTRPPSREKRPPAKAASPLELLLDTGPSPEFASLVQHADLSEQENTILVLLVEGHTMTRIAQELYLSPSAVKYHAKKLYRHFGVNSRSELNSTIARLCHRSPDELTVANRLMKTYALTVREQEILTRLVRGFTTTEMATDLAISENTVKTHVKRIYRKLNVHSKQDVIDLCRGDDAGDLLAEG